MYWGCEPSVPSSLVAHALDIPGTSCLQDAQPMGSTCGDFLCGPGFVACGSLTCEYNTESYVGQWNVVGARCIPTNGVICKEPLKNVRVRPDTCGGGAGFMW